LAEPASGAAGEGVGAVVPLAAMLRLMQMTSPSFPVGAFSYSQGLESACEAGLVHDEASALGWIGDALEHGVARLEAILLARLLRAAADRDEDAFTAAEALWISMRETQETLGETLQMGYSLQRIADALSGGAAAAHDAPLSYPAAYARLAVALGAGGPAALAAYLWAWCENQALAAIKAVPLGQAAGQRMLFALGGRLAELAERIWDAGADGDAAPSNFAPGLAIASACHETQYSRLFRS
jgi:urease accessory protein